MNKKTIRIIIAVVLFLLILLYFFGCQNNIQAKLEAQNIEIVEKYWDAWNNLDVETIKNLFDEEKYSHSRSFEAKEPTGYEKMIENVEWNFEYFPDAKIEIVDIIADGNQVVSMGIYESTYTIDVEGLPPASGQKNNISLINVIWIENGKVVKEVEIYDQLTLYKQIGMELKIKE